MEGAAASRPLEGAMTQRAAAAPAGRGHGGTRGPRPAAVDGGPV